MEWKNCCRLLRRLPPLAALACLPYLPAQSNAGYMNVGEIRRVAGKRSEAVSARIPCSVQPGYHVNSNKPAEEYLVPLKVTWTSSGALLPGEIVYPQPFLEKYEFSNKPLSVLTGKFELVANFKVAPNAPAGPGSVAGKLRYQACNNRACFQPRTIDIAIPYQVQ